MRIRSAVIAAAWIGILTSCGAPARCPEPAIAAQAPTPPPSVAAPLPSVAAPQHAQVTVPTDDDADPNDGHAAHEKPWATSGTCSSFFLPPSWVASDEFETPRGYLAPVILYAPESAHLAPQVVYAKSRSPAASSTASSTKVPHPIGRQKPLTKDVAQAHLTCGAENRWLEVFVRQKLAAHRSTLQCQTNICCYHANDDTDAAGTLVYRRTNSGDWYLTAFIEIWDAARADLVRPGADLVPRGAGAVPPGAGGAEKAPDANPVDGYDTVQALLVGMEPRACETDGKEPPTYDYPPATAP